MFVSEFFSSQSSQRGYPSTVFVRPSCMSSSHTPCNSRLSYVCMCLFLLRCESSTYVTLVQSSDDTGLLRLCLLRCSHPCDLFVCRVEVDNEVVGLGCRGCVRFGDSVCPPTKIGRGCAHKSWHVERLNLMSDGTNVGLGKCADDNKTRTGTMQ